MKNKDAKNIDISFTKKNKNNVNDAIEGKKSYKKLTPEEWHQFVQNYNYDDNDEPFEWLIRQKFCDKGTALCLYWHLQPDINHHSNHLTKEIEQRFLDGFYETEFFSFDPKKEFLTPETDVSQIPKTMQEKTHGTPFDRIDVEFAFLRNPTEKEMAMIRKKIKNAISILQITNPNFQHNDAQKTVSEIKTSIEHWKENDFGKIKIEDLSYLWLDCLREKYHWTWIVWDWETGKKCGMSNQSKAWTCTADTIIKHTIDGFQSTDIFLNLFNDLNEIESAIETEDTADTEMILKFSNDLTEIKSAAETEDSAKMEDPYHYSKFGYHIRIGHYSGIGLLFSSDHLKYQE